jgi:DNA-binding transcriptional LysR family regulator
MGTIDLISLEIFKAVADEGGITKAAAKLHRVQSNVTTRVKQLEERLGTTLFLRQNRRLVLSPAGRQLLAYAERLLRLSSEAEAALRGGTPRGPLRLGALESTAATRLPSILSRYHRAYPDVRIELVTGTTGALVAKVVKHEIEAAFVAEPFVATASSPDVAKSRVITPRASADKNQGRTRSSARPGAPIAGGSGLSHGGVAPESLIEVGSYHAIVACVAAGMGIAVAPRSVVRALLADKSVATRTLPPAVSKARTHLIWRHGQQSIALDALRAELGR